MSAATSSSQTPVIGVAGWKNSGKTTLTVRLVEEFVRRGLKVSTIKHAHHAFQIDDADTDSARHRRAGAGEVAIVSPLRWAFVAELTGAPEPALPDVIARLSPCDLIIVEGYKSAPIPKLEVRRKGSSSQQSLSDSDPHVIAIATDEVPGAVPVDAHLPVFHLDDITAIADCIVARLGLTDRPR